MSHDKGRKWLQDNTPGTQLDVENRAWENFPEEEPRWYPNTEGGSNQLERYPEALPPTGVKDGSKKPVNMAKTTEMLHEPDESLADFCNRLCEACIFTSFDPETPERQQMINSAFEGQGPIGNLKKKYSS